MWAKWERTLLLVVTILLIGSIFFSYKVVSDNFKNVAPDEGYLDFSNATGLAPLHSDFSELLVGSGGSSKKGDGYVVVLDTVNPTSVNFSNSTIIFSWHHQNLSQSTTITNVNSILPAGGHLLEKAFLSPIEGQELKTVLVKESFDIVKYHN